jgi:hypothetical protein
MSETYAGTLLVLISEMFGPTHWAMYKQYLLDILQGSLTAATSADALVQLTQNRAGVVLLHNDLALEMYTGRATDLPCLAVPHNIPAQTVKRYIELCQAQLGAAPQLNRLARDIESMDFSGNESGLSSAEVTRRDALSFLAEESRPTPHNQTVMDALLDAMADMGL